MFEGGCHCARVRFRVETGKRIVLDCNCSICAMKGFLHLIVDAAQLQLVSGHEGLRDYRFGTGIAKHLFCAHCGVHPYYVPRSHPQGYSVNFRCLDDQEQLRKQFEFRHFEGAEWEKNIHSIR